MLTNENGSDIKTLCDEKIIDERGVADKFIVKYFICNLLYGRYF